jgi:hypothetical protein
MDLRCGEDANQTSILKLENIVDARHQRRILLGHNKLLQRAASHSA